MFIKTIKKGQYDHKVQTMLNKTYYNNSNTGLIGDSRASIVTTNGVTSLQINGCMLLSGYPLVLDNQELVINDLPAGNIYVVCDFDNDTIELTNTSVASTVDFNALTGKVCEKIGTLSKSGSVFSFASITATHNTLDFDAPLETVNLLPYLNTEDFNSSTSQIKADKIHPFVWRVEFELVHKRNNTANTMYLLNSNPVIIPSFAHESFAINTTSNNIYPLYMAVGDGRIRIEYRNSMTLNNTKVIGTVYIYTGADV